MPCKVLRRPAHPLSYNRACRTLCPATCPAVSCGGLRCRFAMTGRAGHCVLQDVLQYPAVAGAVLDTVSCKMSCMRCPALQLCSNRACRTLCPTRRPAVHSKARDTNLRLCFPSGALKNCMFSILQPGIKLCVLDITAWHQIVRSRYRSLASNCVFSVSELPGKFTCSR